MSSLRYLKSVVSLKGARVLLRIDANVPTGPGGIGDLYRLEAVLPTLRYLHENGARIIVVSHREEKDAKPSLAPVADYFARFFPVQFFAGDIHAASRVVVNPGEVLFIENLRRDPREEKNDPGFARELAALGDLFVNDAFGAMHRSHASITGIPRHIPSVGGFLLQKELENLSRLFVPSRPCVAIIGGLKFSTKAPLIKRFLETADQIFVVGALANSFFKAAGHEIGISVVDPEYAAVRPFLSNSKIVLPRDVVVERSGEKYVVPLVSVLPGEKIVDSGPSLDAQLARAVTEASSVLWNGPLGLYEKGYGEGTEKCARALAASGAFRVVGGGDTISAIRSMGVLDQFDFVSTGGGAMLDLLAKQTLPGIQALEQASDFTTH